jgi:hypothetical protein
MFSLLDFYAKSCLACLALHLLVELLLLLDFAFTLVVGRVNTCFWLSVENLVLQKLRKQPS